MASDILFSLCLSLFADTTQQTQQQRFFSFSLSQEAKDLAADLKKSYQDTLGSKSNLLTQVIQKKEIDSWYASLDKVKEYTQKNDKSENGLTFKIDVLYKTSDFIFQKILDIYKAEIRDHIVNQNNKENGLPEITVSSLPYKNLDLISIENRLRHGKKIYLSLLNDFKKEVNKYRGANKREVKFVLKIAISCIENGFEKMQYGFVGLKKFVDMQQTLNNFSSKVLTQAYKLIGLKVAKNNLDATSSPSQIFNLKDWEKDNFEHIKMKYNNLLNGFRYLKDNTDVDSKLYDAIKIILDCTFESLADNFN